MKKKLTSFISSAVIGFASMAQSIVAIDHVNPGTHLKPAVVRTASITRTGSPAKVAGSNSSFWLNYSSAADSAANGQSVLYGDYLNWDSIPLANSAFGDEGYNNYFESLGQVLDINAPAFQQYSGYKNFNLNSATPYYLDSMAMDYFYARYSGNTIPDTLIVQLFTIQSPKTNYALTSYKGSFIKTNYGVDTLWSLAQNYSFRSNMDSASGSAVFKILLNNNDTADAGPSGNGRTKLFSTGSFAVPAGAYLGVTITYHSGITSSPGDTLVNPFLFVSYQEDGNNPFPTYLACSPSASFTSCDWNYSSVITTPERYGLPNGFRKNGHIVYAPSFVFESGYLYDNHSFWYHVNSGTTGIQAIANNPEFSVSQNVPNPFSDITMVNYNLTENAPVTLDVFDITGRKIQTLEQGIITSGSHAIQMNSGSLQAGVYFYTLTAGINRITKQMLVVK